LAGVIGRGSPSPHGRVFGNGRGIRRVSGVFSGSGGAEGGAEAFHYVEGTRLCRWRSARATAPAPGAADRSLLFGIGENGMWRSTIRLWPILRTAYVKIVKLDEACLGSRWEGAFATLRPAAVCVHSDGSARLCAGIIGGSRRGRKARRWESVAWPVSTALSCLVLAEATHCMLFGQRFAGGPIVRIGPID